MHADPRRHFSVREAMLGEVLIKGHGAHNMRFTHNACQAYRAPGAVDRDLPWLENATMAKNGARSRSRTFLRHWRKLNKLSQEKAAERIGIDYTTLGRIERGILPYNQDFLERAALAYGADDPGDLLTINPMEPRETDIVKLFRRASPEIQQAAMAVLRTGTDG